MAGRTDIQIDRRQLAELEAVLGAGSKRIPQLAARILNRVALKVQTQTVRTVSKELGIKQQDIKGKVHRFGGITRSPASRGRLQSHVAVTGRRIPVFRFKSRWKRSMKGASYKIGSGKRQTVAHSFHATMESGHVGVFIRADHYRKTARGRVEQPIFELFGPSIPHAAEQHPEVQKMLTVDASAMLQKEASATINWVLSRGRSGGGGRG